MNKSNGSIGTESSHSNDSGCYNNSYSNGGHNYNNLINQLLPNSIKNGLNNFAPKTAASLNDQFDNLSLNKPSNMSVVNLKELVENYAYKFFKENEKEYHRKLGKSYGWKEMAREIDWKGLRVRHEPVIYQNVEAPQAPKSHVLFRSTFINDTSGDQDYQLNAERKTMSSCTFELFEGFVSEGSAELSLEVPLPGCVVTAGAGFKRQYTLENTRSKNIQEELNWSVQSNIKVPKMSKTTAELLVQESQYKGNFEIKTYFSGFLRFKLFKDGQELLLIELPDLDDIFSKEKGFQRDQKGIYRITRGECKATFGIEQKIELHQTPIQ